MTAPTPEVDPSEPKDDPKDTPEIQPEKPKDDPDPGDPAELGDAGKRALDAMKRERNAAKKERQQLLDKIKAFEDKDKSETQRLQEAADEAKTRASKAEVNARKLQTALDCAPDGTPLKHIKAVAKRLSGDTEEELQADAEELFQLLAPGTQETTKKTVPGKPKETLTGGGDPGEEPEEKDPRKLADLIGRH